MSKAWAKGSTRRWRRVRALVLADNQAHNGGRCQLGIPDVCATWATHVHHTLGREVTGDDPRWLVASCEACNLHIGDPARRDPPARPRSTW